MRKDLVMHLAVGTLALIATAAIVAIAQRWGLGPALAAATTALGGAYEWLQRIRREGVPSRTDWAYTAAPGWIAWISLEVVALWRGPA